MTVTRKGESPFRPRARLLVLLGEQLITNEVIAVVELVKNSYDADATKVDILLEGVESVDKGKIVVKDDGLGMSLDTILNVWLEPATDFRKKQRDERQRTEVYGRVLLGEKGVGRFAAHKLGGSVQLITRAEGSTEEIKVEVDWQQFEREDYLDKIPIKWEARTPEVFKGSAHGTVITIKALRKTWDSRMVQDLYLKLQGLNSPLAEMSGFTMELKAKEFENVLGRLPDMSEILASAVYKLDGSVDSKGMLKYSYVFHNPAFRQLGREIHNMEEDIKNKAIFRNGRLPACGAFTVKFHVWDRDPATLRETVEVTYFRNYIDPHTGVRVYRDRFRVWPYGERDDDWLGLDLRRVQAPPLRLSRNQVIGVVEISFANNPELRDKTDREGLISNREFEDFREQVISCISVLERERRKDKNKVDRLRERKRPEDAVQKAINGLRGKMETKGHLDLYEGDLRRVESSYQRRMKEIIEPLIVSAGLGLAYTLPVHELTRNVGDAEKMLSDIIATATKAGVAGETLGKLNQLLGTLDLLDDVVRGVGRIGRKGRREVFALNSAIRDSIDIMALRLKESNIEVETKVEEDIRIKGLRNMITTAVLNLLDNSAYWLLHRVSGRKIVIRLDRDTNGNPRIMVSDNGPGIKDDPAFLIEPFYTRKPDGSGLGLYIVDRAMKTHDGGIEFLVNQRRKDLLEGANVALIFPRAIEAKK